MTKLNDAERERLYLLMEEASEVIQACSKILRHGYTSYNPDNPFLGTNKEQLQAEIGDFIFAYHVLVNSKDIKPVTDNQLQKILSRKKNYLHYNHLENDE